MIAASGFRGCEIRGRKLGAILSIRAGLSEVRRHRIPRFGLGKPKTPHRSREVHE